MQKRKIVVSDYDGTFFVNKEKMEKNIEKVDKFRRENNLFVIATGNNFKHFREVMLKYKIKCDYLILDQGACIFDNKGTLCKSCFLDYEIVKKIVDEIKQTHNKYKLCNPYTETATIEENNITKIVVNCTDLQKTINFTSKINEKFKGYVHAYTMIFEKVSIVEIISSKTDKSKAIKYIADKENILPLNIYTIGNGYNDISMIQNFNGYCMKSSVDELLDKCPNKVDSVAELIEEVISI